MNRRNIAVFFGGRSPEYDVSLQSAAAVLEGMDSEKYRAIPVGIDRAGDWFFYDGGVEAIRSDKWRADASCVPALLSPRRSDRALLVLRPEGVEHVHLDAAFPVMHGKNGEDGRLQGLIELAGIPLVGCGTLASALCMDKVRAHRLAAAAGVRVPEMAPLTRRTPLEDAHAFAARVGFPLYVKPVRAGSSFGITRVTAKGELAAAIEAAFQYDDEVVLEENISGCELGCAVLGGEALFTGEVDEIELAGGFFDYGEKYTLKHSAIHVPARISAAQARAAQAAARRIYRALGCSGFARVDLFLTTEGEIVFNEVNTIPGFTVHSRYPGMMAAAGLSFAETIDRIIGEAVGEA